MHRERDFPHCSVSDKTSGEKITESTEGFNVVINHPAWTDTEQVTHSNRTQTLHTHNVLNHGTAFRWSMSSDNQRTKLENNRKISFLILRN